MRVPVRPIGVGLVLGFLGGCVPPGRVEVNDLVRLQQALRRTNPQDRAQEGLGLMRPVGGSQIPSPEIETDLKTNRRRVSLSLQDVILRALVNNTDIGVVAYTPAINREQMTQAAAAFDAVLFANFAYTNTDSAQNDRLRKAGATTVADVGKTRQVDVGLRKTTVTGASASITGTLLRSWDDAATDSVNRWYLPNLAMEITQPLLRNGWPDVNLASLRIARLNHDIGLSQFRDQVEQTLVEVISAYYWLHQTRQDLAIVTRLLETTRKTYDKIVQRGSIDARKTEIKQAEASLKLREVTLLQALKAQQDAQDDLVRRIGGSDLRLLADDEILPTTPLPQTPVAIDPADQLLTALRLNPALEQARLGIRQSRIRVRVAENQLLPQLDLTAGADFGGASRRNLGPALHDVAAGHYADYHLQIALEYPLGNREARSLLAQRRLETHQAVTQMQSVADQLAVRIRERIREINTRQKELVLQKAAVAAAREQLDALENLEKIRGALTPEFLNVKLQAQATLAAAEQGEVAARVQYNTALLDLARATGAVLEMNQVKLALPIAVRASED